MASTASERIASRDVDRVEDSAQVDMCASGRSPLATLTGVQILGLGAYVPETVVRNEDLSALGCDPDWIIKRTGIRERRHAAPHEATSDLAYQAAMRCLANAGVAAREVDMVLMATMTPDMLMPSAACMVQRRLGSIAPADGHQCGLFRVRLCLGHRHAVCEVRLLSPCLGDWERRDVPRRQPVRQEDLSLVW